MAKRGRPPKIKIIELPIPTTNGQPAMVIEKIPYTKPEMRKEFIITFTSIPEKVICPYCKVTQFTVNQGSTNAEIVRICKCGTKTTYKFEILPFGITTSSPLQ